MAWVYCLQQIQCYAAVAAGVHARAAGQLLNQLEPLRQQLAGLSSGSVEGDWEGALELMGHLGDALRQASSDVQASNLNAHPICVCMYAH